MHRSPPAAYRWYAVLPRLPASPEHLVSDDGILSRDDVVDVGGEPLQEARTCRTKRHSEPRLNVPSSCTYTHKAIALKSQPQKNYPFFCLNTYRNIKCFYVDTPFYLVFLLLLNNTNFPLAYL